MSRALQVNGWECLRQEALGRTLSNQAERSRGVTARSGKCFSTGGEDATPTQGAEKHLLLGIVAIKWNGC